MKKYLIFSLLLIVACGPSEEEIQARIDKAVKEATSTTKISNNLNTNSELSTQALFEDAFLKCELTFSNLYGVELSSDKKQLPVLQLLLDHLYLV